MFSVVSVIKMCLAILLDDTYTVKISVDFTVKCMATSCQGIYGNFYAGWGGRKTFIRM